MYQEVPKDPTRLQPEFWAAYQRALAAAAARGVTMVPYCMERSIYQQARLWRQSRSGWEVRQRISLLESKGAPFMASALHDVGPQSGDAGRHTTWVTLGWHQFGEAVDAYWALGNKASWSTKTGGANNGYRVFRQACRDQGLQHLRGDWPHIQFRTASPLKHMSYVEADQLMESKYG